MIGRAFATIATALTGTGIVFFILETRRQRALLGETPPQTLERDTQATAALQGIMQDVRQDNLPDLLINGGTALMDMSLNAINERAPEVGQPLLTMFNGARAFSTFNSLMQNAAPATTAPNGFSFASLLNLTQPAGSQPVQAAQSANTQPVQSVLPAQLAVPTLQNQESVVNEQQTVPLMTPSTSSSSSSSSSSSYSTPKP